MKHLFLLLIPLVSMLLIKKHLIQDFIITFTSCVVHYCISLIVIYFHLIFVNLHINKDIWWVLVTYLRWKLKKSISKKITWNTENKENFEGISNFFIFPIWCYFIYLFVLTLYMFLDIFIWSCAGFYYNHKAYGVFKPISIVIMYN